MFLPTQLLSRFHWWQKKPKKVAQNKHWRLHKKCLFVITYSSKIWENKQPHQKQKWCEHFKLLMYVLWTMYITYMCYDILSFETYFIVTLLSFHFQARWSKVSSIASSTWSSASCWFRFPSFSATSSSFSGH